MNNVLALVTLLLLLVTGCAGAAEGEPTDTTPDAGEPAVEPVGGSGGQGGQAQAGTASGGAPVQTAGTGGQAPTAGQASGGTGGQAFGGSAGQASGGTGGQAVGGEAGTTAGGSAGSDMGGAAPVAGTGGQSPVEPNACEVPLATARDCTGTCADAPNGTACTGTCAGMAAGNCTPPATGFQSDDGYVVLAANRGTRWALPANACARFTAMEGGGAGYLLPGGSVLVDGETKAGSACMVAHNTTNGSLPVNVTSTWKKSWVRVEVSFSCDLTCP